MSSPQFLHRDRSNRALTYGTPGQRASTATGLSRLLHAAAVDWGLGRPTVKLIVFLPVLVVVTGCVAALLGKPAYLWFVSEDGFAENLQVVSFGIAAGASLVSSWRLRGHGDNYLAALLLVCGLLLAWVVGEELSWGQRLTGMATPEVLARTNRQGELNLHSIYPVERALRLAQFLVGIWATVVPLLLLRYGHRLKARSRELNILVPHYSLVLYFFGTMMWRAYHALGSPAPESLRFVVSEWSEVIELNLALGVAFHLIYVLRLIQTDRLETRRLGRR